jgi:hypothetical protein
VCLFGLLRLERLNRLALKDLASIEMCLRAEIHRFSHRDSSLVPR